MCQSKAQGGQRCVSHARHSLVRAEGKYAAAMGEVTALREAGQTIPDALVVKAVNAQCDRDTALAVYASTKKGEADLRTRAASAKIYDRRDSTLPDKFDLEGAITEGLTLRARNARIKKAVKDGTMTKEQAKIEAQYPGPGADQWRQRSVEAALEANRRSQQERPIRLASVPAAPTGSEVDLDFDGSGTSRATIEPNEDGTWTCEASFSDEVGYVVSEDITTHPSQVAAETHARRLALEHAPMSEAARARVEAMTAYYEDYDATLRQAMTPEGNAALKARLETLPKVNMGYHNVNRDRNPSPQVLEAEKIHEALQEAEGLMGADPASIPHPSAVAHRNRVIYDAAKRLSA